MGSIGIAPPRASGRLDWSSPYQQNDPEHWTARDSVAMHQQPHGNAAAASAIQPFTEASSLLTDSALMPEDGNLTLSTTYMAVETAMDIPYVVQMALVGAKEGFRVHAQVNSTQLGATQIALAKAGLTDRVTIQAGLVKSTWTEDNGEIGTDGNVLLPGPSASTSDIRSEQSDRLNAQFGANGPNPTRMSLGQVENTGAAADKAALASALGKGATVGRAYLEGGNTLSGIDAAGKPYAVIGKDSVAASRTNGETDAQVMAKIAADLRLPVESVIAVEQPASFHLDMAITLLPGKRALVNDAVEAQRLQEQWTRESGGIRDEHEPALQALRLKAQTTKKVEDLTAAQLAAAGFKVERIAGDFQEMDMNFMNAELATGGDGKMFSVMLGGDPRAEAYIAERYQGLGFERNYFLDRSLTNDTLSLSGGIGCRTKNEGTAPR